MLEENQLGLCMLGVEARSLSSLGWGRSSIRLPKRGVRAATEQEMLDLIFAREIQAGGRIMVDTVEEFFKAVTFEERCRASGIEDDDEWP